MQRNVDIEVRNSNYELQLIVEIKNLSGKSDVWAAQMRRNLIMHQMLPKSPFFLLVLRDHLYLWKDSSKEDRILADFKASTQQALKSYLVEPYYANDREFALEIAVFAWLDDIVKAPKPNIERGEVYNLIYKSGLYDAIRGGCIDYEAKL